MNGSGRTRKALAGLFAAAAVTYGLAGALAVSAVPGVAGAVVSFRAWPGGGNGQRIPL